MITIECQIELNDDGTVLIRAAGKQLLCRHAQWLPVETRALVKAALEAKLETMDPIERAAIDFGYLK